MAVIEDLRAYLSQMTAQDVNELHRNADTDLSRLSLHHTLGPRGGQAAPGDHTHNGTDSAVLDFDSMLNFPSRLAKAGMVVDDWNNALDAGFYRATAATLNGPPSGSDAQYHTGWVTRDSNGRSIQYVTDARVTGDAWKQTWKRIWTGTTWSVWVEDPALPIPIATAADLNSIVTPGVYSSPGTSGGTIALNYPSDSWAGTILVYSAWSSEVVQVAIRRSDNLPNFTDNETYVRGRYGSNWSPWKRLLASRMAPVGNWDAVKTPGRYYSGSTGVNQPPTLSGDVIWFGEVSEAIYNPGASGVPIIRQELASLETNARRRRHFYDNVWEPWQDVYPIGMGGYRWNEIGSTGDFRVGELLSSPNDDLPVRNLGWMEVLGDAPTGTVMQRFTIMDNSPNNGDVYVRFRDNSSGSLVWTPWVLNIKSGAMTVDASMTQSDLPVGITYGVTGSGWPTANGTILTINQSAYRCFQIFVDRSNPTQTWIRAASGSTSWMGWRVLVTAPNILPDPVGRSASNDVNSITSTTAWGQSISGMQFTFNAPAPMWVQITLGAWVTATAGDTRAGIDISGATVLAPSQDQLGSSASWGQTLYLNSNVGGAGTNVSSQLSCTKTVKLNAGNNVIAVKAYQSGGGTHQVNYPILQVTPLYYA